MNSHVLIEMIGYTGSALVVVSMLMSSVVKLRVVNTIGSIIFAIYALIIKSYPTALMNFCLVSINVYHLIKLTHKERHFELLTMTEDRDFIEFFLSQFQEDIRKFFPEFRKDITKFDTAFLVCNDIDPAGVLLGNRIDAGTVEVLVDYSTPTYRDCSVGEYLYEHLPEHEVRKVVMHNVSADHEEYARKMGFKKTGNDYEKVL